MLFFFSCTKEGLPGPQGPEGAAGEPGIAQGGGGGTGGDSPIRVITFFTPSTASFSWEPTSTTNANNYFRLIWKNATNSNYRFLLPDSLTSMINEGALLVYARIYNRGNSVYLWRQLSFTPADFYDVRTYSYSLELINNRYSITMLADMVKQDPAQVEQPETCTALKFVIIPKTESEDF